MFQQVFAYEIDDVYGNVKTNLVYISLLFVGLCGCMHTVIFGGSKSPDKRYCLGITSHGASAKAYVAKSRKRIWITITSQDPTNSATLFQRRFVLVGSDIDWHTRWSSDEAVSVDFYDWGDGVSNYKNMQHLSASNHIASFSFARDRTTGKFIERK